MWAKQEKEGEKRGDQHTEIIWVLIYLGQFVFFTYFELLIEDL